jgi:hypothetical protein
VLCAVLVACRSRRGRHSGCDGTSAANAVHVSTVDPSLLYIIVTHYLIISCLHLYYMPCGRFMQAWRVSFSEGDTVVGWNLRRKRVNFLKGRPISPFILSKRIFDYLIAHGICTPVCCVLPGGVSFGEGDTVGVGWNLRNASTSLTRRPYPPGNGATLAHWTHIQVAFMLGARGPVFHSRVYVFVLSTPYCALVCAYYLIGRLISPQTARCWHADLHIKVAFILCASLSYPRLYVLVLSTPQCAALVCAYFTSGRLISGGKHDAGIPTSSR